MESELIKYFITQGAFAALFVWLLADTRKDSKQREIKYQDTIKENQDTIKENQSIITKLTEKFDVVDDIKQSVEDIKNKIFK